MFGIVKYMFRWLAVMTLMMWPAVPLFLLLLHLGIRLWRRIGLLTYPFLLLLWAPVGYLMVRFQTVLLGEELLGPQPAMIIVGLTLFSGGVLLHIWTARLLGWRKTVGLNELRGDTDKGSLITSGPFSLVRHPTYDAHTLIIAGIFLLTGYEGIGFITLIDFLLSYLVVTAIEEKELVSRFGDAYLKYRKKVPRMIPVPLR